MRCAVCGVVSTTANTPSAAATGPSHSSSDPSRRLSPGESIRPHHARPAPTPDRDRPNRTRSAITPRLPLAPSCLPSPAKGPVAHTWVWLICAGQSPARLYSVSWRPAQQFIQEQVCGVQLTGKEVAEAIGMDPGQARAILREMRLRGECPERVAANGARHSGTDLNEYVRGVIKEGWQLRLHRGAEVRDVVVLF